MARAADEASARFKAHALLVALDTELAEGDAPSAAAREVLDEVEGEGVRASVRGGALAGEVSTHAAPTHQDVTDSSCALVRDDSWWRGCQITNGAYEAYVQLPVTSHVRVVRILAASMAGVVLLAWVAVLFAARATIRKPLQAVRALAQWSERVAASTESPPPAPQADAEELQRLAGSLEALVGRLTAALARERATSAHIAHELRTPLTALRAELEALGDARVGRLLGDVDRLARVIDAILLLASPTDDRNAGDVVNVADVARGLAPEGAAIEAPDEALIRADERLVELALVNLLENSLTHGGRAASALRVTRVGGGVRVAIVDEGTGVDPEMLQRLFEPHWRGPGSNGAGLGLALVRAVALRYDGAVDAAPGPSGKGLEVGITFGRVLGWNR